jgi:arabinoxylan arabinofuranohydrolase
VVFRNGFYYLYFGNGGSGIGVVRSTNPTGPWTDPVGSALVTPSTPGAANVQWCFDPAVLIDDDGQAYLYFGGGGNSSGVGGPSNCYVIRLNSDMISVNGPAFPLTPQPPQFFEASQINKINGLYYFYYSTDFSVTAARIDYMISSNSPVSNFIYIGTILSNPPNNYDNNNHAAFGQIGTNWYIAYHNREQATLDGVDPTYHRSVCLDLLYFNTDGTIQLVIPTTNGVAQLSNLSPYQTFLAVTMNRQFGGIQTTNASNNFVLACNITNGCCIKYKGLNFGSGAKTFQIQSSGGAGNGGVIDIWLDSPNPGGTNIGSVTVPATGNISSLKTSSTSVSSVGGIHDLYLRFRGSGTNLFYLYSWNFSQ